MDELKPTFDKDFGKKAQVCCSLAALLMKPDSCIGVQGRFCKARSVRIVSTRHVVGAHMRWHQKAAFQKYEICEFLRSTAGAGAVLRITGVVGGRRHAVLRLHRRHRARVGRGRARLIRRSCSRHPQAPSCCGCICCGGGQALLHP